MLWVLIRSAYTFMEKYEKYQHGFMEKQEKYPYFSALSGSIYVMVFLTLALLNKAATPSSNLQPIRLFDPGC